MDAWKRQFIRDLFPYSASRMRIERAFSLNDAHVPTRLYKYRRFCRDHIDALKRNVLWLSAPKRFNDPHDAKVRFDLNRFWIEDYSAEEFLRNFKQTRKGNRQKPRPLVRPIRSDQWRNKILSALSANLDPASTEPLLAFVEAFFKDHHDEQMRRMSEAFRNNFSVLCLAENYSSGLMWAHYSDGHKGFCIEYDFAELASDDVLRRLCFPVFYTNKLRDATRYLTRTDMTDFNNLFGLFMCLMKKDEWGYEREWRIVDSVGARNANREITMPKPSGILLGTKVAGKNEAAMRAFCRKQKIPLRRMAQLAASFEFEIVDLEL